jgi:bifunctional UDP-N-acetylglucosamine pyrophosphorylase/glucosamine-1-phosphate N-acetyltransferase
MQLGAIVLAAGQGKRMKSKLFKVLHPVCGKPMVQHVVDRLSELEARRIVVVVGHGGDEVRAAIGETVEFASQAEQLGTAHAVMQAAPLLQDEDGITLVLYGDTPLLTAETLRQLVTTHQQSGAGVTLLTAHMTDPTGYGRIIRDAAGEVTSIVEQKDCTPAQSEITEINTGTYCFDNRKLFAALREVKNENAQSEYYLTDVVAIMRSSGSKASGYLLSDPDESIGVNDRVALAEVEAIMRHRIAHHHMLNGVTLIDPASTYIGADVRIGPDTVIHPGSIIRGKTTIGEDCIIGPQSEIDQSIVGDGTRIHRSILTEAVVGTHTQIGPFAYLRPGSQVGDGAKIGDFVELKNAVIGNGSKIPHLSYVGDATIGNRVNIGCGSITANYDGINKHRTIIEDDAFIGSNSNLIAPVRIGESAYVVAGSTITKDVEAGALAIGRARQTNKLGYAVKLKNRISGNNHNHSE